MSDGKKQDSTWEGGGPGVGQCGQSRGGGQQAGPWGRKVHSAMVNIKREAVRLKSKYSRKGAQLRRK